MIATDLTEVPMIEVPQEIFEDLRDDEDEDLFYVVTLYNTPILFPVERPSGINASDFGLIIGTSVLGFTIPNKNTADLNVPVIITFQHILNETLVCWYVCETNKNHFPSLSPFPGVL